MEILKTKSFELAVYKKGDETSEKLILCLPGQLDTKDYPHMRSHVDYFSKKGYLAVSFDPAGTWESPGDINLYTITNYIKAVNELIEYFGNRSTVLLGHSRGGSTAMVAGTENNSVTHIIAVMSNTAPSKVDKSRIENGVRVSMRDTPPNDKENQVRFDLPINYFNDVAQYNPLEALTKSNKPKLFIRGTQDNLVNPEEIKNAYDKSAEPKMYHEVDSDHDYRRNEVVIEEINEIVDDFLKR